MVAAAQPDSLSTQMEVLQSPSFLGDAMIEANPSEARRHRALGARHSRRDSNVISITVEGGDPKDAAKLANTIVDLHLKRTDLLQTTGLQDTMPEGVSIGADGVRARLTPLHQALCEEAL